MLPLPRVTAKNCVRVLDQAHHELDRQPHNEEMQKRFLQVWAAANQNYSQVLAEHYSKWPHVIERDGADIVRKYQAIPAPRMSTHPVLMMKTDGRLLFDYKHVSFQGRTRDGKHFVIVSPQIAERASIAQGKALRAEYGDDQDKLVAEHWRDLSDADFWYRFAIDWMSLSADGWPDDVLEIPAIYGDIRIFAL